MEHLQNEASLQMISHLQLYFQISKLTTFSALSSAMRILCLSIFLLKIIRCTNTKIFQKTITSILFYLSQTWNLTDF